jgi:hypothetical protein
MQEQLRLETWVHGMMKEHGIAQAFATEFGPAQTPDNWPELYKDVRGCVNIHSATHCNDKVNSFALDPHCADWQNLSSER